MKTISDSEALVAFHKLDKPVGFPSFPFLHGYLAGITTTPSMIVPSEWQEVLFADIIFEDQDQLTAILNLLYPLTNHLLDEIHHDKLCIPAELVSDASDEQGWKNLVEWTKGFTLANQEFRHLWEITLDNIATKVNDQPLADELWNKLVVAWTALTSASKPEVLDMLRQSEPFQGKSETELHALLCSEYQANIRFLANTCERLMLIQQRAR